METLNRDLENIVLEKYQIEVRIFSSAPFEKSIRLFKAPHQNNYVALRELKKNDFPQITFFKSELNAKNALEDYDLGINFHTEKIEDFKQLFELVDA